MSSMNPPHREASDMLEDALQHFDTIIDRTNSVNTNGADDPYSDGDFDDDNTVFDNGVEGVAMLMEDLRNAVEATLDVEAIESDVDKIGFGDSLLKFISLDTLKFYRKLLRIQNQSNETESEKVSRLISENESLSLHVSVLTDQIEVQTEKLDELNSQCNEIKHRLSGADNRLQEELAAKTDLETEKLQLLDDVSKLKLAVAQHELQRKQDEEMERKRLDTEARNDQYKILMKKLSEMKGKVIHVHQEKLHDSNKLILFQELVENLEKTVAEKDKMVEELLMQVERLKSSKTPTILSPDEGIVQDHDEKNQKLLQLRMPVPFATSTPISTDKENELKPRGEVADNVDKDPTPSTPTGLQVQHPGNLHSPSVSTTPSPANLSASNMSGSSNILSDSFTSPTKSTKSPKNKSSSTPNLAMTEVIQPLPRPQLTGDTPTSNAPTAQSQSPFHQRRKQHGFRKFFSSFRLRRSRSSSLEQHDTQQNDTVENFQRGGLRSTAGPRLAWNPRDAQLSSSSARNDNLPFARWDTERVCQWMIDIGMHGYVDACKKWVKNGDGLLRATNHELEKELGIRHPLHKKKLMLHLQALGGVGESEEEERGAAQMNAVWVARWLDDIGLPQYKDSFHEACIDGRTLHHLTVGDAQKLRVTNLFHLCSLRRAVEILRICQFDPTMLKRRPVEEGDTEDISLWTNHRVMEWLRCVDLAEYAPNLRGSGVHGAVMVFDPNFTSETLSALLHIPHSKSLLRRHLAAKLDELLPEESVKSKQLRSQEPGYAPINVAIKYKIGRRSFGGLGRLRGASAGATPREFGSGEYVCPISNSKSKTMAAHRDMLQKKILLQGVRDKKVDIEQDEMTRSDSGSNIEVVELNESTTREINAFSAQLNTLTNNWSES
uniref:liprin-beta-1-like isoform X2 n=1 Tax=Ciona intestinalis TaxID=7719 RepID=UPI00089DCB41|nr:liprin-beta-1-like isoform X2 [Ciona intestinalis]|eukprot:XP_018667295.1 liprin-beta-1-like isoform X2 [Ciona intestinalis]